MLDNELGPPKTPEHLAESFHARWSNSFVLDLHATSTRASVSLSSLLAPQCLGINLSSLFI